MMRFQIRLADRIIEIHSLYKQVYTYCETYTINSDKYSDPDIVIESTYEDLYHIVKEMRKTNPELYHVSEDCPDLETIERISIYEKIANAMLDYDTLLIHGAVVSTDNMGYMITAPSGVGKTTRTKIWIDNIQNSIVVNGDKPFIRFSEDEIVVYGSPWSGKEGWNHNTSVPLKAVFFLERADEEGSDTIIPMDAADGMIKLLSQTYQPPDNIAMYRILQLFKRMEGKVQFYLFRSTPTPEAVKLAYETVEGK